MKKKIKIIAAMAMVGVLAFAGFAGAENASTPQSKSLTLQQAITMAMENNSQIEAQQLAVKSAELDVDAAKRAAERADMDLIPVSLRNQNIYLATDVAPLQAKEAYEFSLVQLDYLKNSIAYGVETAYYGLLTAEKMEEVNQTSLNRAQAQLKDAQAKFDVGTVAKIDVLTAESNVKTAEVNLSEAKNSVKQAEMALNQLLRLPLDTPLDLKDKLAFQEAEGIDLANAIAQAKEKDATVRGAKMGVAVADAMFTYQRSVTTPNTDTYRKAQMDLQNAKISYDNALTSNEMSIRSAYMNLSTAKENYSAFNKSMELASEAYRLTQLRYQAGMATPYELIDAETTLKQAELGQWNALQKYLLAVSQFHYGIYTGGSASR